MNPTLLNDVCRLVKEAEELFFTGAGLEISNKGSRDYVTQVDLAASEYLVHHLPAILPGSRVFSEELAPSAPIDGGYCWVIDPVDGTTNLIYSVPLYTISIGLLYDYEPVLGVVYNPASGEMFCAAKGYGAFLNGKPIRVCDDERLEQTLVLVETNPYADRTKTRSYDVIGRVFLDCIDYRVIGSAALDICYVASGRCGVFFAERLRTWDCVGGFAILQEAGGQYTNWQGEAFSFTNTHGESLIASNRKLHDTALKYTKT